MQLEHVAAQVKLLSGLLWGLPLIGFIICSGIIFTVALRGVQFRYFFSAWRYLLSPEPGQAQTISPLQAFLNTLSASVGNGSLAGMAAAVYSGGPGAAFWVFVLGFFTMAIRYAEVFAATYVTVQDAQGVSHGGPIAYLQKAPGGIALVYVYISVCLIYSLVGGAAMQCNSITDKIVQSTFLTAPMVAGVLFLFLLYVLLGGAQRVLKVSDRITPIKVGLFFVSLIIAFIVLYAQLWGALKLIVTSALMPQALAGGVLGFSIQNAIRFGMSRSLNATEVGLGTASILYGGTGSKDPVRSGIMSMAASFISNHLVCFGLMLFIVASGAWSCGIEGINMTSMAFSTVYGSFGAWVVLLLSVMFGLGVLVAYIYIGRECWIFLTGGRFIGIYSVLFALIAVIGSLSKVAVVWDMMDILAAFLVVINLYALFVMLPTIRRVLLDYQAK